ncbi:MAG: UDP-N-acetylmuramate--L-alanine ligase [Planctomycetota bacterium]|nr:MAG: UDP-N-acetylmuramate--L-alanine ligase [Planctomycetota bacterium]
MSAVPLAMPMSPAKPSSSHASISGSSAHKGALAGRLPRRVHLLGLGGAGVSGAARILHARSHVVSGHDRAFSPQLEPLRDLGIELRTGESRAGDLPGDVQAVVRSAAVPDEDPQVLEARRRGIPVLKYAELLPLLARRERTLAVAGTHGKTTTSWMLLHALRAQASDGKLPAPGALIGGNCRLLGTNALASEADAWFVVEACEYDRSFLHLEPAAAIITNVDEDHLDYYGSRAAIEEAFARFADRVSPDGLLVLGRDVPASVEAAAGARVWRAGREFDHEIRARRLGCAELVVRGPGWASPPCELAIPGDFNADNAALALALAVGSAGLAGGRGALPAAAARGVAAYPGAGRRFEPWGSGGGIDLVHDYAHHPVELRATLAAARARYPGRALHVLFQPHQHSRTARFLHEFAQALSAADRIVISDVYGARTHIDGANSAGAKELVALLVARGAHAEVGGDLQSSRTRFSAGLVPGAVGFVIGAGDVENVRDGLLRDLAVCRT